MTPRAREYLAKAQQYEQRAKKMRNQEEREWHLCVARAYRVLGEAEVEPSKLETPDKARLRSVATSRSVARRRTKA
jgi:hypothetical protein